MCIYFRFSFDRHVPSDNGSVTVRPHTWRNVSISGSCPPFPSGAYPLHTHTTGVDYLYVLTPSPTIWRGREVTFFSTEKGIPLLRFSFSLFSLHKDVMIRVNHLYHPHRRGDGFVFVVFIRRVRLSRTSYFSLSRPSTFLSKVYFPFRSVLSF